MCLFIVYETMCTIGESRAISHEKWHRTTSTTSGWKCSPVKIFRRNSYGECRPKFTASGEDGDNKKPRSRDNRLAQRRQHCQHSDHKHVKRQRQHTTDNNTANEADEEREHRLPTLQKAMRTSGNACILQSNYLLRCNDRHQQLQNLYNARQEYLFNGLRTAY